MWKRDLEDLITPAARLGWVAYAAQNRKIGSDGFDQRNFRWGGGTGVGTTVEVGVDDTDTK